MPPLPMISVEPEILNQSSSHLENRNEAVPVTAPTVYPPARSGAAAGEQWKLTALSAGRSIGSAAPSSTTFL